MARKQLPRITSLIARHRIEPLDYLLGRLQAYAEQEQHALAEKLALDLMPYVRRKQAPEPHPEELGALRDAPRLVVVAPDA